MKKRLVAIVLLVLALRLWLAYASPNFSSIDSYEHLRQVEHILEKGVPFHYDPLSWGGRNVLWHPLFDYILAFFSLFLTPYHALKIMPNIFAVSSVVLVSLLAKQFTKKQGAALWAGVIAALTPIFVQSANSVTIHSLGLPLLLLLCYSLLRSSEKCWRTTYLIVLVFTSFLTPFIMAFVVGLGIYLVLVISESLQAERKELELVLFTIFFALWAQFIMYKDALFFHGTGIFLRNMPPELVQTTPMSMLHIIYLLGIIPLLGGLYILHAHFLRKKSKGNHLIAGMILAFTLLLWLRLLPPAGLMYLGVLFAVYFGQAYNSLLLWWGHTRLASQQWLVSLTLIVIIAITAWPALSLPTLDSYTMAGARWLENTPKDVIVASSLENGAYISAVGRRANIIDHNIFMIRRPMERYLSSKRLLTTFSQTEAVEIMDKYHAEYLFTNTMPSYAPGKCFQLVFQNPSVIILHKSRLCRVRER